MARQKKDTFFQDLASTAFNKVLVGLSQDGKVQVGPGNFPGFQVYEGKGDADLMCDLACCLTPKAPPAEKQQMAREVIARLEDGWANNPFTLTHTANGLICLTVD